MYTFPPPEANQTAGPFTPGADFDLTGYPILAKHFGIKPHRSGPCGIAESPALIATERGIAAGVERKVARCDALA